MTRPSLKRGPSHQPSEPPTPTKANGASQPPNTPPPLSSRQASDDAGPVTRRRAAAAAGTVSTDASKPCASTSGTVFVTVGTTKFDALIEAVDDPSLAQCLADRGYKRLVVQRGGGEYKPSRLLGDPSISKGTHKASGLEVEFFEYAPSLQSYLQDAALVISHAGAGSIFESLGLGKTLIAVPNPLLMHNHQTELSGHLEAAGNLFSAAPAELQQKIREMKPETLRPYVPGDPRDIARVINRICGVEVSS